MKITASYLNNNQFGHDVSRSLSKRKRASKNFRTINNTSSVDLAFTKGTFSLKCTHFHLLPLASLCRVEFKRTLLLSSGYHIEWNVCVSHHLYSVWKSFINESFLKFFLMNLKVSWDQFSFFLLQMSIFWAHMGIIRWSRKMKKFY